MELFSFARQAQPGQVLLITVLYMLVELSKQARNGCISTSRSSLAGSLSSAQQPVER